MVTTVYGADAQSGSTVYDSSEGSRIYSDVGGSEVYFADDHKTIIDEGLLDEAVTFTRADTTYETGGGKYTLVPTNDYASDYDLLTGDREGVRIEEASSTEVIRSCAFGPNDADWGQKSDFIITPALSIFKGQTAWRYENKGVSANRLIFQNAGVLTASPETAIAIVEQGTADRFELSIYDQTVGTGHVARYSYIFATDAVSLINADNGTTTSAEATVLSESGPNGGKVVLLKVTGTPNNAGNNRQVRIFSTGSDVNANDNIIHFAQHEEKGFATSPMVSDVTHVSRAAGPSSYLDENGTLVSWGQYKNELTWSGYFENSAWSTAFGTATLTEIAAPVGGHKASLLTANNIVFGGLLRRATPPTYLPATSYTMSCYAKKGTARYFGLRVSGESATADDEYNFFDLETGVATQITPKGGTVTDIGMIDVGNGWYHCYLTFTTIAGTPASTTDLAITDATGDVSYTPSGTETVYIFGADVRKGGFVSYEHTTHQAFPDYQGQYNNELAWSEDFSNGVWAKLQLGTGTVPVVTPNVGVAPDGTVSADKIDFDLNGGTTSGDISYLSQTISTTSGLFYTESIWLKTFDGSTKVFRLSFNGASPILITVTGEWQRFDNSIVASATTHYMRLSLRGSFGTADSASILAWGAQQQEGPLTDYEKTQGGAYPTYRLRPQYLLNPATGLMEGGNVLNEAASTNKCTNFNANPTDLTGVTLNDTGTGATLEVVDNPTLLASAGLDAVCNTGKMFKLVGGTSDAFAHFSGTTGNTNTHRGSAWLQSDGAAQLQAAGTGASGNTTLETTPTLTRLDFEFTSGNANNFLRVRATSGTTVYFILNQLEESDTVSTPIVVAGSSDTRPADVTASVVASRDADVAQLTGADYDAVFGRFPDGFIVYIEADVDAWLNTGDFSRLFQFEDTGNPGPFAAVFGSQALPGTLRYRVDDSAGTSVFGPADYGFVSGTIKVALKLTVDDMQICVDGGTLVTDTSGTPDFANWNAFYIGSEDGTSRFHNDHIKNLVIYPPTEDVQALTA